MEIEKFIKELNELYSMKVKSKDNELMLTKHGENISLNFIKDTNEISTLLNSMQKQTLIGFDDFDDLKDYQNKTWNYTKIISGWKTREELLDRIEATNIPKELCIHLFNINELINLYAIAEIMDSVDARGYSCNAPLFNVSLSTEHINCYPICP